MQPYIVNEKFNFRRAKEEVINYLKSEKRINIFSSTTNSFSSQKELAEYQGGKIKAFLLGIVNGV